MFLQFCAMPVHIVYICVEALPSLKSEICLSEGFFEACDLGSEIFCVILSWPSFGFLKKWQKRQNVQKWIPALCRKGFRENKKIFVICLRRYFFSCNRLFRDIKLVSLSPSARYVIGCVLLGESCLSGGLIRSPWPCERNLLWAPELTFIWFVLKKWQKRQNVQKWVPPLCRKGFRANKEFFVICFCGYFSLATDC